MACLLLSGAVVGVTVSGASARAGKGKSTTPTVLYVGTINGITTPAADTFTTIQAAVTAAKKGDWILIAPGDYRENADVTNPPTASDLKVGWYGGVDIETSDLHLRGMNRNTVVVDGTQSGPTCSPNQSDQNFLNGDGRNGILVWQAKGVSIDNLTVCNFLAGSGNAGNEIWWNGGKPSSIGLKGYEGSYLTATSTYFQADAGKPANVCSICALYGIFASHAKGSASLSQLYANNFSDSGVYVGACLRVCDVTIDGAWMEHSALGYSGTNSGGQVIVKNSTFDDNKDGFDTNTALTGDSPPPQDGRCPGGATSPITGTTSCWVFMDNLVENNNDPNVPIAGTAALGPTGTGMTISGGRNDTIMDNKFLGNDAWGILFVPYPDGNLVSQGRTCKRERGIDATGLGVSGLSCLFDPMNDVLLNNEFSGNGGFANVGDADFGNLLASGNEPVNCFSGNTEWNASFTTQTGVATDANAIDGSPGETPTSCGTKTAKTGLVGANTDLNLLSQAECDAGLLSGPLFCTGATYPTVSAVTMNPLPGASSITDPQSATLPSMPDPCSGAPSNLWCPNGSPAASLRG